MASVKMLTLGELFNRKYKFKIPGYQRGYRWRSGKNEDDVENSQVLQLLTDILEYKLDTSDRYKGRFYCLQPLVIVQDKNAPGTYLLVDGQQRLTTFLLIMLYLEHNELYGKIKEKVENELGDDATQGKIKAEVSKQILPTLKENLFFLSYATKDGNESMDLSNFLFALPTVGEPECQSIDEYYMANAYKRIKEWFEKDKNQRSKLYELLKNTDKTQPTLQFIWYELDGQETSDQEKLFNRINKGKIPLTSAELIKAFMFGKFQKQIDRAMKDYDEAKKQPLLNAVGDNEEAEKCLWKINQLIGERKRFEEDWEKCENILFDDTFWNYMCRKSYNTRIEYIFELMLSESGEFPDEPLCNGANINNPQHTFILFRKWTEKKEADEIRDEFFNFFQKTQKYYLDWRLYHLIGFLVHLGIPFVKIHEQIKRSPDLDDSVSKLKQMIFEHLFENNVELIFEKNEQEDAKKKLEAGKKILFSEPTADCSKEQEEDFIKKMKQCFDDLKELLEKLDFNDPKDKEMLRNILLFFNIVTLLQGKRNDRRFPFQQYRETNWDLEHICSQKNEITKSTERNNWLYSVLDYYAGSEFIDLPEGTESEQEKNIRLKNSAEAIDRLAQEFGERLEDYNAEFNNIIEAKTFNPATYQFSMKGFSKKTPKEKIWRDILCIGLIRTIEPRENFPKCQCEDSFNKLLQITNYLERGSNVKEPEKDDTLKNLTLLDERTNRTYHNAPFFVKRKHIIKVDSCGRLILPCTRDAFLKVYSKSLDNLLYWDPEVDGTCHLEKITETFVRFFVANSEI